MDRRDFIVGLLATGAASSSFTVRGASLADIPLARRGLLGKFPKFAPPTYLADLDTTRTDYSGMQYCPFTKRVRFFGGGHAATPANNSLSYALETPFQWENDYPATSPEVMFQTTLVPTKDGAGNPVSVEILKNLNANHWWEVPGETPRLKPPAQHTYGHGFLPVPAIGKWVKVSFNPSPSYGFRLLGQAVNDTIGAWDPATREWEDWGITGFAAGAYAVDPVSGNVLMFHNSGLRVLDVRARKWIATEPIAQAYASYSDALVYFPPNDRFYLFPAVGNDLSLNGTPLNQPPVIEAKLDRETWQFVYTTRKIGATSIPYLKVNWRPPRAALGETQWAYDPDNQMVVGGNLADGTVMGFKPLGDGAGEWWAMPFPSGQSKPGAYDGALLWHFITWVPDHHAFHYMNQAKEGVVVRWDPVSAFVTEDPGTGAIIEGGSGRRYGALGQAAGNETIITLRIGSAPFGVAAPGVHLSSPTWLVGVGDVQPQIWGAIEDKGIVITDADVAIVNVLLSGAAVGDGNGAGVRHESGNLLLKKVTLSNNQDGYLGSNSATGTLRVEDCDIYGNGTDRSGQSHGLYISELQSAVIENCRFWDNHIGHHIKSRAFKTTIRNCEIGTNFFGDESYNIDLPQGGDVLVENCTLRQGPYTDNDVMVDCGGGPAVDVPGSHGYHPGGSLVLRNVVFENTNPDGIFVRNRVTSIVPLLEGCRFNGPCAQLFIMSAYKLRGCYRDGVPMADVG